MSKPKPFQEIISEEVTLTLGDRINYPFLLAKQIDRFQNAIVKEEGTQSPQEITEAAEGLYAMIPTAWRITDKIFADDVEAANITFYQDQRAYWCGYRVGPKTVENQIPYVIRNPYRLYHACIDLLQRRGLLARTVYTEVQIGTETEESSKEVKGKS